jgi:hypothetical protein
VKNIFLSILILPAICSFAQNRDFETISGYKNAVGISSGYFFASNAINNRFALGYIKGEFIDDVRKKTVSDKLSDENHIVGGFQAEIRYERLNDTIFNLPRSFYSVSLKSQYHLNSTFSKDAFELFFRGNKSYAGKKANLSNFKYNQLVYQQVNFTFGHAYKFNTDKFTYTAGLSLTKGQKLYNIHAPKASIFTEINGEYLDLDADLNIHQSDSSKNEIISWNGTGASVNFSFSWKNQKNNSLNFSVDNFGFIQWNNQTAYIKSDTAFRFEGVDVSDLFLFSDSIKEVISLDSSLVEPYLSVREKKSYQTPLPARLNLSYRYMIGQGKMDVEAAVSYLFFAGYQLMENLSFSYTLNNTQRFSLICSYGGYSGFQAGFSYHAIIMKRWLLGMESNYLSSMLNPDKGCAQGAFVSLSAYF